MLESCEKRAGREGRRATSVNPLSQRVVEALDVIGFARQRADRPVLSSGNDSVVSFCVADLRRITPCLFHSMCVSLILTKVG
jgi:hypothetical protein